MRRITTIATGPLSFRNPSGLALDSRGNLFVACMDGTVHKISNGQMSLVAGKQFVHSNEDGPVEESTLDHPKDLCVDDGGNIYVTQFSSHTIRKILSDGFVTTFAGKYQSSGMVNGYRSDARFFKPNGIVCDSRRNLFVVDAGNNCVRKIDERGNVVTLAGDFNYPFGIALVPDGSLLVTDLGNFVIKRISTDNRVTVVVGTPGRPDVIRNPNGIVWDNGCMFLAEYANDEIVRVERDGTVSPVIQCRSPTGVAVRGRLLYWSDFRGHEIRKALLPGLWKKELFSEYEKDIRDAVRAVVTLQKRECEWRKLPREVLYLIVQWFAD